MEKLVIENLDDIIDLYQKGIPLQRLSRDFGISRPVLIRRFRERGVEIRSYSDGQAARWATADDATKRAWLERAWAARRNGAGPAGPIGRGELEVGMFLAANGFDAIPQHPVFKRSRVPYKIDFAIKKLSVAVEVVGCGPKHFNAFVNSTTPKQRLKHILDQGWFVIFVIARGSPKRRIDLDLCGEHLLSYLKLARRDETVRGKYGVVWGNAKPPAFCSYDFGDATFVRCPATGDDLTRDRYVAK